MACSSQSFLTVEQRVVVSIQSALVGVALAAWSSPVAAAIPSGRTPAAKLAPAGFEHQQVLRIDQDFHPNDHYDIALDAWVEHTRPDAIAEVRMWWTDRASDDERSPFGKGVRRHIDIGYTAHASDRWTVDITQGRKSFTFFVERIDSGTIAAFADVDVGGGELVEHCRVQSSRLVAKKILGLPAGLKRLDVTCVDDEGRQRRGHVVHESRRR
jgi:hypothetical protein